MSRKYKTIQIPALCLVILALGVTVTSCARKEKPKAPEKKSQTFTVAPTPAVEAEFQAVRTGAVKIVRMGPTGMVHSLPTRPQASTPGSKKALRDKQKEFAIKVLMIEVQKTEKEIDGISAQIQAVEACARFSNSTVKVAAEILESARQAYERERYALTGMGALKRERDTAKARLAELNTKEDQQNALNAIKEELRALTQKMYDIEMAGRTNSAALTQALDRYRVAESTYQTSLQSLPEYRGLEVKFQELLKRNQDLLENQSAFGHQEK